MVVVFYANTTTPLALSGGIVKMKKLFRWTAAVIGITIGGTFCAFLVAGGLLSLWYAILVTTITITFLVVLVVAKSKGANLRLRGSLRRLVKGS
ncbi:hypothetical protein LCGC14_0683580 [marine sediment metagenome]|uniref:Uncharacterized protein n=1 Tax=marine sediment metagenome TaxID=412755 RepID=A0A0F9R7S3_9ZZZZ